MAKDLIKDGNFVMGDNPPRGAVAPRMTGKNSKAPVGDAANSASPPNPGNLNVLRMLSADSTFKTGHSK